MLNGHGIEVTYETEETRKSLLGNSKDEIELFESRTIYEMKPKTNFDDLD